MTETTTSIDSKIEFAEKAGLVFAEMGMPHSAGKILSWLMVCEPPHQSLNQLAETLQMSKSSISTSTRILLTSNFIEKKRFSGERHDYYQLNDSYGEIVAQVTLNTITQFKSTISEAINLRGEDNNRTILQELFEMYTFFERRLPLLLEEWTTIRKEKFP